MARRQLSEQRVKEIIAEVYMQSPRDAVITWRDIGPDFPLYDAGEDDEQSLGLDSLDGVEIAARLEEEFDLVMPAEVDAKDIRTVRNIMALLGRLLDEQGGGEA